MAKLLGKQSNLYRILKVHSHGVINDSIDRILQCNFHILNKQSIRRIYSIDTKNANVDLSINKDLREIFNYKDTRVTNWIVEAKIQALCNKYENFMKNEKKDFLLHLASQYSVNHENICNLSKKLACIEAINRQELIPKQRSLKNALTPDYQWLFILMGRLEHGVKFLVDLRTDTLNILTEKIDQEKLIVLQQLNITLHDLLLLWFSVGFLHLERITWQSSCDMLQKISDYEAIHPIRNWLDLKRRVGSYRRCYVFTHPSMPREPLVVLHTALCDIIPETVKGIGESEKRMIGTTRDLTIHENKSEIKAAIFYSIASTQRGLKGIDLGNYIIKEVAREVKREFPTIDQLSSLSPIPKFRSWLFEKLKQDFHLFTRSETEILEILLNTREIKISLRKLLNNSLWTSEAAITEALKGPLTRVCAWYLYKEKHRNYALDSVAHFHLRNGAIMWRINWMADPSPRGADNSCGIMVNYRYFLNETEDNSRKYIENYVIKASESVIRLASEAEVNVEIFKSK